MSYIPSRGDLVYLNFNPHKGHEQAGRRPGIVLSPQNFNHVTGFSVVCPITNQVKGYPFEEPLPDQLLVKGVILTDQVKSLDWKSRNFQWKDTAPSSVVQNCLDKIHTFL